MTTEVKRTLTSEQLRLGCIYAKNLLYAMALFFAGIPIYIYGSHVASYHFFILGWYMLMWSGFWILISVNHLAEPDKQKITFFTKPLHWAARVLPGGKKYV